MKKILITNIILFLAYFVAKIINYKYLLPLNQEIGLNKVMVRLFTTEYWLSNDANIVITDYASIIILLAVLINIFFAFRAYRK